MLSNVVEFFLFVINLVIFRIFSQLRIQLAVIFALLFDLGLVDWLVLNILLSVDVDQSGRHDVVNIHDDKDRNKVFETLLNASLIQQYKHVGRCAEHSAKQLAQANNQGSNELSANECVWVLYRVIHHLTALVNLRHDLDMQQYSCQNARRIQYSTGFCYSAFEMVIILEVLRKQTHEQERL